VNSLSNPALVAHPAVIPCRRVFEAIAARKEALILGACNVDVAFLEELWQFAKRKVRMMLLVLVLLVLLLVLLLLVLVLLVLTLYSAAVARARAKLVRPFPPRPRGPRLVQTALGGLPGLLDAGRPVPRASPQPSAQISAPHEHLGRSDGRALCLAASAGLGADKGHERAAALREQGAPGAEPVACDGRSGEQA